MFFKLKFSAAGFQLLFKKKEKEKEEKKHSSEKRHLNFDFYSNATKK